MYGILSLIGLWLIVGTLMVQAIIATVAHRRQARMVPGIMDPELGHESFVFLSVRTFKNSLENALPFIALCLLALITGFNILNLMIAVWVFAIARLVHMVLYYQIATEKNPSPRSYFYILGLLSALYLLVHLGIHLISLGVGAI